MSSPLPATGPAPAPFHPDARRRLAALEERLAEDLALLNDPPASWVPPTAGPDGRPVTDVVVVGGGMCGLVAAFALRRAGISNIRILDRNPAGFEGPWVTYARMETLRSPKQLLGPAYGLPSLTFQAWYRATHGASAWEQLFRIPRPLWMEYLRWYRAVLRLPVENGVHVARVGPAADGLLALEIAGAAEPILARRVVLANGREGLGKPTIPAFMDALPRERWAHSMDDIDFEALKGRRVVVIGVGASAVDNAATALEAGAAEVRLLARRAVMPTVNKLMGVGSYGLVAGFPTLSPDWRWRIMNYAGRQQTPAPSNSTRRVGRFPNAFFHFDAGIARAGVAEGGAVRLETAKGRVFETDFVILGTGFTIDAAARPELEPYTGAVAAWRDRYVPPPEEANEDLASFPWLAEDFSFTEKTPGAAPWLSQVHCFNYGATMSLGKVSGDIPAISEGAAWLTRGIAAALFRDDVETHWASLLAYSKPELIGDEWTDADAPARAEAV